MPMVAIAMLLALAVVAWSFSAHPIFAIALFIIVGAFAVYFIERMVRFAEKNPAAALLGGTEFYHHLKDQTAAKDPKVINDDRIAGAVTITIEHQAEGDV
jgi:hypothetical protein